MLKEKFFDFLQKMLYLGIFRLEFEKAIVTFEMNVLELLLKLSFMQKGNPKI